MMATLLLQVAALLTLPPSGDMATPVQNRAAAPMRVTLALHEGHIVEMGLGQQELILGGAVANTLVTPQVFVLAPGEQRTVRLRVRTLPPHGTVLRLVTTFTPLTMERSPGLPANGTGAQVVVVTRLITKVVVE